MPKVTIVGAGSLGFSRKLMIDILSYPELSDSHFSLMDVEPKRLDYAGQIADRILREGGYDKASWSATPDRREALEDADYVIVAILVGGYEAIELCSIPGMGADHIPDDASPAEVADIERAVAGRGLAIDSIGGSCNLADPEARKRFVRLMELAAEVGAPVVASGPGGVSDDEESFAGVVKAMAELGRRGEELGVRVAIKPHHSSAAYSTPTARRLMAEVDSEWVRLNFDASHIFRANEDPVESLRTLAPFVSNARIRDAKTIVKGVPPLEDQVCGAGIMDLPGLVRTMRGIDGLDYVVLEIVGTNGLSLDQIQPLAEKSAEYLRGIE